MRQLADCATLSVCNVGYGDKTDNNGGARPLVLLWPRRRSVAMENVVDVLGPQPRHKRSTNHCNDN
eukprot:2185714-Amphidinium_carterae.1